MALRHIIRSIDEVLRRTAAQKHDAALARRSGASARAEPSRAVFASACAEIAARFDALGFRFAKSGPHISKHGGDFLFKISFQSSFHNIPGSHVALRVAATVSSPRFKAWRAKQPHPISRSDAVAGGLLGNLLEDQTYIEWDLADRESRAKVVDDAAEAIQEIAIPYFERFSDPPRFLDWLQSNILPSLSIGTAIELALSYDRRDAAMDIAALFLRRRSELAADFHAARNRFTAEGLPLHSPNAYAEQLGFVAVSQGLDFGADASARTG